MRLLIDGRQLVFRCAVAQADLTAEIGGEVVPTGGVFGFLTTLQQLIEEWSPNELVICWEGGIEFRRAISPDYKANRVKPDDEVAIAQRNEIMMQERVIKMLLARLGAGQAYAPSFEADDVLYTLAHQCKERAVIYTADSDLLQAIRCGVAPVDCLRPIMGRETLVTYESFMEEHGFPPYRVLDVKALAGDKSDNVSGVPGIGKVWAEHFVRRYSNLEAMRDDAERRHNVEGVKLDGSTGASPSKAESILANWGAAERARALVQLYTVEADRMRWITPRKHAGKFRRYVSRLRMKTLLRARPMATLERLEALCP